MIFEESYQNQRLKWAFMSYTGGAWGTEPDGDDGVVCIRAADIDGTLGRLNNRKRTLRSLDKSAFKKLKLAPGDIIIEKSGGGEKQPVGRPALFDSHEPSVTSNFLVRCRPADGIQPEYINYVLLAIYSGRGTFPHLKQSTGIQNLDIGSFFDIRVNIPAIDEQKRITEFLDDKTQQINQLIDKKLELLDRLAEKRQALITQSVYGDIESKGYKWLKWSVDLIAAKTNAEEQETLPYMSNASISSWTGKLLEDELDPKDAESKKFKRGDVLFNKLRPYLAKVYHADFDGVCSSELLCLRSSDSVNSRFLHYALLSKQMIDSVNAATFGSKMPRADWEIIGHQFLPLPPLDMQIQIANYLDGETQKIDTLTEKVNEAISLLEEHRSALITSSVTGQLSKLL